MQAPQAQIHAAAEAAIAAHDRHRQTGSYEDRVRAWRAERELSRLLQIGEERDRTVRA